MNSIANIFNNGKHLLDSFNTFVDKYIGSQLLRKCGISKIVDEIKMDNGYTYCDNPIMRLIGNPEESIILKKIVSAKELLVDKMLVGFSSSSAYQMFKTNSFFRDYKKDTFYRFDRNPKSNWERLQLETAKNVINDIVARTGDKNILCLVFDDSLYERVRGKGTELCARVHDHTDHKNRIGFRMMTGGWTNGETFIPFSQSLLSTRNEQLMIGPDTPVDRRTLCGKRRELAKTKGTEVVFHMVQQAKKAKIPFDYVLFDTWFSNPAQLIALRSIDVHTIAMIKKNKTKYTYTDPVTGNEQKLDVKEIYSRNKKRRGRSKYLLSVNVSITDKEGNSIPAKLIYARNHSNRKEWVCFVCTDPSIDEETVLRTYTLRWSVELYFRMAKSYLRLRTECHSTSYDAITAHMVIVALRYMVLAIERFNNSDNRSLVDIFYGVQREIINEMMDCAIVLVLDVMLESVRQQFCATDEQINQLIHTFIKNLPTEWRERFSMPEVA